MNNKLLKLMPHNEITNFDDCKTSSVQLFVRNNDLNNLIKLDNIYDNKIQLYESIINNKNCNNKIFFYFFEKYINLCKTNSINVDENLIEYVFINKNQKILSKFNNLKTITINNKSLQIIISYLVGKCLLNKIDFLISFLSINFNNLIDDYFFSQLEKHITYKKIKLDDQLKRSELLVDICLDNMCGLNNVSKGILINILCNSPSEIIDNDKFITFVNNNDFKNVDKKYFIRNVNFNEDINIPKHVKYNFYFLTNSDKKILIINNYYSDNPIKILCPEKYTFNEIINETKYFYKFLLECNLQIDKCFSNYDKIIINTCALCKGKIPYDKCFKNGKFDTCECIHLIEKTFTELYLRNTYNWIKLRKIGLVMKYENDVDNNYSIKDYFYGFL